MATITLTDLLFYAGGQSGVSSVVGFEGARFRSARYTMTAPAHGATSVELKFSGNSYGDGSYPTLRVYIGTDPGSHANATLESPYSFDLVRQDDFSTYSGNGKVLLLPNTTYYVWVFPASEDYGWMYWSRAIGAAMAETQGAAQSIITGSGGTLGQPNTLYLTSYASDLTHEILAACGDASIVIGTDIQADTVEWVPPVDWAVQNTAGSYVTAVITCVTQSDGVAVGQSSVTLTFQIPLDIAPTASLAVSDSMEYLDIYGSYIQGKSKAAVQVVSDGSYGSAIESCVVCCGSLTGSGKNLTFELPSAGTIPVKAVVTDTRGRTATAETNIQVAAYSPPIVEITSRYRSDASGNEDFDGSLATVVFNASVTPLDGKNTAEYAVRYRAAKTDAWSSVSLDGLSGNYTPNGAKCTIEADTNLAYEICVVVEDNFGSVRSSYRTIQVSFALFDADRANKALGLGQRATIPNAVSFGLRTFFNAGVSADFKMATTEAELEEWLSLLLSSMEERTMRPVSFYCPELSGAVFGATLFRSTAQYATLFGVDPGSNIGVKSLTPSGWSSWVMLHTGTDVQVFAIDDGNGNITIVSADVVAEDDGNGNITLSSSAIVASDDGNGNITLSYI